MQGCDLSIKTREYPNYLRLADVEALYQKEVKAPRQSYKLQSIFVWPRAHIEPQRRLGTVGSRQLRKHLFSH